MNLPPGFRPEVRDDLDEAYLWYEAQRPGPGEEYLAAVRVVPDRIATSPERQAVVTRDVRRSLIRRFSAAVDDRIEADRILVLAVVHGRRDPRRWQSRRRPRWLVDRPRRGGPGRGRMRASGRGDAADFVSVRGGGINP